MNRGPLTAISCMKTGPDIYRMTQWLEGKICCKEDIDEIQSPTFNFQHETTYKTITNH